MTDLKPGDKALLVVEVSDDSMARTGDREWVLLEKGPGAYRHHGSVERSDLTPVPSLEDVVEAMYGEERLNWPPETREVANRQAREVLALLGVGVES